MQCIYLVKIKKYSKGKFDFITVSQKFHGTQAKYVENGKHQD